MLPFLKPRQQASTIVIRREPDETPETEHEEDDELEAVVQDLIDAIHARDVKSATEAIKAAFEIADSYPHEEGPHPDEEIE